MKIYINKRYQDYSNNSAVVAANSRYEAHKTMCAKDFNYWLSFSNYNEEEWQLLEGTVLNVEEPQILAINLVTT